MSLGLIVGYVERSVDIGTIVEDSKSGQPEQNGVQEGAPASASTDVVMTEAEAMGESTAAAENTVTPDAASNEKQGDATKPSGVGSDTCLSARTASDIIILQMLTVKLQASSLRHP